MARFYESQVGEVAQLNVPRPDKLMITHASALRARGVSLDRPEGDIDIVTTQENLAYLRRNLGFIATREERYYEEDLPTKIRMTRSQDGRFDVFGHDFIPELYRRSKRGRIYPDQLFSMHDARFDQDEDTGIWVASIPFVIATKIGTGRPKDAQDIERAWQFYNQGY
jgi:hypothetical protein